MGVLLSPTLLLLTVRHFKRIAVTSQPNHTVGKQISGHCQRLLDLKVKACRVSLLYVYLPTRNKRKNKYIIVMFPLDTLYNPKPHTSNLSPLNFPSYNKHALHKFCQIFAGALRASGDCPSPARALPSLCPHSAHTLPTLCPHVALTLPSLHRLILLMNSCGYSRHGALTTFGTI